MTEFKPGERVVWNTTEGGPFLPSTPTRRAVTIISVSKKTAIVAFGQTAEGEPRQWSVNLSELSRAQEAPFNPAYFPGGKPFEVEKPSAPLPNEVLQQRVHKSCERLQTAHRLLAAAQQDKKAATTLASHAAEELSQAQAELRQLRQHEADHQQAVEIALRANQPPPKAKANGLDKAEVENRTNALEAASAKFNQELAEATARLTEANASTQQAAREVIGGLLAFSITNLQRLETLASNFRAELHAVAATRFGGTVAPLALERAAADYLAAPPPAIDAHFINSTASKYWTDLYDRLVSGEQQALDFDQFTASLKLVPNQ